MFCLFDDAKVRRFLNQIKLIKVAIWTFKLPANLYVVGNKLVTLLGK